MARILDNIDDPNAVLLMYLAEELAEDQRARVEGALEKDPAPARAA